MFKVTRKGIKLFGMWLTWSWSEDMNGEWTERRGMLLEHRCFDATEGLVLFAF